MEAVLRVDLLLEGRGGNGSWQLLRRKSLTALLLKALFSTILPDLDHVVLPAPPSLLGVNGDLVSVPADLGPRARPQRHRF